MVKQINNYTLQKYYDNYLNTYFYKKLYLQEKKKRKELEIILSNKEKERNNSEVQYETETTSNNFKDDTSDIHILENNITTVLASSYKKLIPKNNNCFTNQEFWYHISNNMEYIDSFQKEIEYLLHQFGTKEPCNRFDVGNCIELIVGKMLVSIGFDIITLPNARRVDLSIMNYKQISIKYSSCGNITLHNSNSCINNDIVMTDTLIVTPDKLYLINVNELAKYNINIQDYLKNASDSLKLKRSLLTRLKHENYSYMLNIRIQYDKTICKNRLCYQLYYKQFLKEYNNINA